MSWLHAATCMLLAASLTCQHEAAAPAQEPAAQVPQSQEPHPKDPLPPLHAPQPELPPLAALAHVQAGNRRAVAARRALQPVPEPEPRPAGAGRFVVAVVTCADAAIDVPRLLGLRPEDVLLISNAGAVATADAVELVERAVQRERLSLCIVLSHAGCASLEGSPVADERASTARDVAARRRLPLERAHALIQCERLLGASDLLRARVREGTLRVAPATLGGGDAIEWLLQRAETLPLAPVR